MEIKEIELDEKAEKELIALSRQWAEEDITYGYIANKREDIEGNRIFAVYRDGRIIGYLFGKNVKIDNLSSVIPKDAAVFEVEELYVLPQYRSKGLGKKLFMYAEEAVKAEVEFITLGTATKNHRAILHFYVDEVGMNFYSARLFKKIGESK